MIKAPPLLQSVSIPHNLILLGVCVPLNKGKHAVRRCDCVRASLITSLCQRSARFVCFPATAPASVFQCLSCCRLNSRIVFRLRASDIHEVQLSQFYVSSKRTIGHVSILEPIRRISPDPHLVQTTNVDPQGPEVCCPSFVRVVLLTRHRYRSASRLSSRYTEVPTRRQTLRTRALVSIGNHRRYLKPITSIRSLYIDRKVTDALACPLSMRAS